MTNNLSNGERLSRINGVELGVETFGNPAHPAILLIDGAAASMLWWEAGLCARIAAAGRFVIRYDNRDTGRSTSYPPGHPGYSMTDLAEDAVGVLDALGIERAHVVGRSMGGGMAVIVGVDHPDRVASLTFVSASAGIGALPPSEEPVGETPAGPDLTELAALVDYSVAAAKAESGGSPHFDEAAIRALIKQDVERARNFASTLVNHFAMEFTSPVRGGYRDIGVPTLVVHGDRDPLVPLSHGEALSAEIPGAELLVLPGVGHAVLPEPVWDVFVPALAGHTAGDRR
ncbi:alpha/beta hydrolase [Amycolatopsis minnesotensis]|uniref:AB hydrolase-1 domain-containing protein n=1 Tax=Amycolatopsis minnesotensis TaxID=337894 RepID=A0ABP5BLR4_9PSEU